MADAQIRVSGPQGRRVVPITRSPFTINRRTSADLQIDSTDVSRTHAEIVREGESYILRDCGSRYGTYVNDEPVTERNLVSGDRVRLGRTGLVELEFQGGDTSSTSLRDTATDMASFRNMAAVLDGLRALGSGRVLPEVLMLVVDAAIEVTKAERGFVMLADERGNLEFKVARGRGRTPLAGDSFSTSSKIPRDVFSTGRSRIFSNLDDVNLAPGHDVTRHLGIRYVLCVPLRVVPIGAGSDEGGTGRVLGVLYLDGRERATLSSRDTLASLEVFATQAAIAIESARLYAEEAEKRRIEREMQYAAETQRAMLPEPSYAGDFCDLAAVSVPCRTVGGDFYDHFVFPGDRVAFSLGDVAGKGAPAALQAAAVQVTVSALAQTTADPASTMDRTNTAMLRRAVEARFATMFYGVLEADGTLRYCNAGQEPPLVVKAGGAIALLEAGGPVLGLLPAATYDGGTVALAPGDLVVVFSDGVTEAQDAAGEEFGRDGVVRTVAGCHGARPEAVMDTLMAAVRTFVAGGPQADDITVLVARYLGSGGGRAAGTETAAAGQA